MIDPRPNPDPLRPEDVDAIYEHGFQHGLVTGRADSPIWPRVVVLVIVLVLVAFGAGRVTAAPRAGSLPSFPVADAGQLGAPSVLGALEPGDGNQFAASSEAPVARLPRPSGAPPLDATEPNPSPDIEIGTAMESGIIAYANPSFGDRYLALPGGPGIHVRICSTVTHCLNRTSNDAGPDLAMQRRGRIADVSFVDFAWLCGCDPRLKGTMHATIEYGGPTVTPPATDVEP